MEATVAPYTKIKAEETDSCALCTLPSGASVQDADCAVVSDYCAVVSRVVSGCCVVSITEKLFSAAAQLLRSALLCSNSCLYKY